MGSVLFDGGRVLGQRRDFDVHVREYRQSGQQRMQFVVVRDVEHRVATPWKENIRDVMGTRAMPIPGATSESRVEVSFASWTTRGWNPALRQASIEMLLTAE